MIELLVYGQKGTYTKFCQGCGKSLSIGEAVLYFRRILTRRFPNRHVVVQFVDVFNPRHHSRGSAEILSMAHRNSSALPIITLNGEIVSMGDLDVKNVLGKLDTALDKA
ncbi:MAG: DUF1462 family protein [Firmicutes bacterium]|nr:DUF1462 family protein [Bacillota bacterium]